jgi:serine/threonine protein kinase
MKDENVLIIWDSEDFTSGLPRIKLIDFGNASFSHFKDQFKTTAFDPTPIFTPPEYERRGIILPEPFAVWTIGVILYTMLEGDMPFRRVENIARSTHKWKRLSNDPESLLSKAILLTDKCLNKKVNERINLNDLSNDIFLIEEDHYMSTSETL